MSNLFNNNYNILDFKLTDKEYYDFFLYEETIKGDINLSNEDCIVAEINLNNNGTIIDGSEFIYSTKYWDEALNNGVELNDIGLTGMDNGFINYNPNEDNFDDVFLYSKFQIQDDDKRFFMKPVNGYYYDIDYSLSFNEENGQKYFSFNGGFLQGFYKLFKFPYQTLPNKPKQEWAWEFIIRPRIEEKENTLNHYFPDNKGFFFYMGTRAENKFWYYSNKLNEDKFNLLTEEINKKEDYFLLDYLDIEELKKDKSKYETMMTSSGILLNTPNIVEFETDNKYLLFNRTCCGYNTYNFDNEDTYTISYQEKNKNLNYYLLFNRTKEGLKVSDFEMNKTCCVPDYIPYKCNSYLRYNLYDKPRQTLSIPIDLYDNTININKDIYNNNIGFRITDDGEIGYRYLIKNCDEDKDVNPVKVIEEYSEKNMIKFDKWQYIVIRYICNEYIENPECSNKQRKCQCNIYVNGKLIFVSQQLDEPIFKELNEYHEKQEGVPFNLSLGGGSQGLLETMLSDNPDDYDRYVFPIEKYFCGTSFSDLLMFRFNNCGLNYNQIKNYYQDYQL